LFYDELGKRLGKEKFDEFFGASKEYIAYIVADRLNIQDMYGIKDEIEKAMFALNSYFISQ